ncbi:MAG: VOC family protein [Candidatus Sumerlaeaceae bacterium]|nr:VOC family protein [Candidatus Sumerlaeaceae bacterium]
MPAELSKQIMHATLKFGDNILMGADCPPDYYLKPAGITVSIGLKDATEGERIFNALAEGGTVKMPFQKTFWSPGFGMCIDRFDIPWMVNCDVNA